MKANTIIWMCQINLVSKQKTWGLGEISHPTCTWSQGVMDTSQFLWIVWCTLFWIWKWIDLLQNHDLQCLGIQQYIYMYMGGVGPTGVIKKLYNVIATIPILDTMYLFKNVCILLEARFLLLVPPMIWCFTACLGLWSCITYHSYDYSDYSLVNLMKGKLFSVPFVLFLFCTRTIVWFMIYYPQAVLP